MIPRAPPPPAAARQSAKVAAVTAPLATTTTTTPSSVSRRAALALSLSLFSLGVETPHRLRASTTVEADEAEAFAAYAERDFEAAERALTRLLDGNSGAAAPSSSSSSPSPGDRARLLEMRAAAYVDDKRFPAALADYDAALEAQERAAANASSSSSSSSAAAAADAAYAAPTARARLLAGRALAKEGISDWNGALTDYLAAEQLAAADGAAPDPYIRNSVGNCQASLGKWQEARQAYLEASDMFQRASGFRGRGGSTTARLDGAVFSASNAALALAQLGDEEGATREAERVARRAPGSADMRAALAALYWSAGRRADAEGAWEFACSNISVGCSRYRDREWLSTVRRWPPVMVDRMSKFLAMS